MTMTSKQRWVLGVAVSALFVVVLDVMTVPIALTAIQRKFRASMTALEWTVNGYNLAFVAMLVVGVALGGRFGGRRVFLAGLGMVTAASAACALAPGIGYLITARAFQGAGAGLVMPLAVAELTTAFPPQIRGRMLGVLCSGLGLAVFGGPFLGGAVTQGLAWQWIFWINIPPGLTVMALTVWRMEDRRGPVRRVDISGVLLVAPGALGIVWGLVRGNTAGWGSVEVVAMLTVGSVLMAVFIYYELPVGRFHLFEFVAVKVANFCLFASLYGAIFMIAQYLQAGLGNGPLGAGLRLTPWTAAMVVVAPVFGMLIGKRTERRFVVAGLLMNAIGLGWLALVASGNLPYPHLLPPLIVSGCGVSVAMPGAQGPIHGHACLPEIGGAPGSVSILRILSGVFGVAVLGAVFVGAGGDASPQAFAKGFAPAIGVAAAVALAGAVAGLGMPRRRKASPAITLLPYQPPLGIESGEDNWEI